MYGRPQAARMANRQTWMTHEPGFDSLVPPPARSTATTRHSLPLGLCSMRQAEEPQADFSLAQTRHIVKDLFAPNPWIYWSDFLCSLLGGVICFGLVRRWATPFSWQQGLLFVLSGVLYYRAALFIHESVHLRHNSFHAFRFAWNLLCGIPFLMPSFMYYTHAEHHMRKHFGTETDAEYLALGTRSRWHIFIYLLQPLVIPALAVIRFLVFAPLSWVSPRFRGWVHRRASTMVMDPSFIRPLPSERALKIFRVQEVCCFLVTFVAAVLLIGGWAPIGFLLTIYPLSVFVLYLNHVRTLGAHRYTNAHDEMTFVEQLLDSVNYPNRSITTMMWAPVGLRFHALHHLFPTLPYHNLAKAHRKLMAELPADSPYRLTESPSLWAAIKRLWATSKGAARAAKLPAQAPLPHSREQSSSGQLC